MKTKILIVLAIAAMFYGCSKDTYNSKPHITIKSTNSTSISPGGLLLFEIEFTDKEGDIQDTLYVQKISKVCPTQQGVQFLSKNRVPSFTPTSNLKGILEIGYGYNTNITGYESMAGCSNKADTAVFKFWLKDKANNISDTITSPNIILLK
ncbi:hypothetical protein GWC95_12020 [Sediminibacterium roseum]|uniref:Lipoprotein n=1 Tax=Sediminibacterium roseum TaxID=1978412 RepID=A0ABW9ZU37_9BACT|nr:hypothetical protein [Sediminibacterium roseum]NCI50654.1 hypothetical protein [Sediminibacterium roseum]